MCPSQHAEEQRINLQASPPDGGRCFTECPRGGQVDLSPQRFLGLPSKRTMIDILFFLFACAWLCKNLRRLPSDIREFRSSSDASERIASLAISAVTILAALWVGSFAVDVAGGVVG